VCLVLQTRVIEQRKKAFEEAQRAAVAAAAAELAAAGKTPPSPPPPPPAAAASTTDDAAATPAAADPADAPKPAAAGAAAGASKLELEARLTYLQDAFKSYEDAGGWVSVEKESDMDSENINFDSQSWQEACGSSSRVVQRRLG
jgi:hypothetical protein